MKIIGTLCCPICGTSYKSSDPSVVGGNLTCQVCKSSVKLESETPDGLMDGNLPPLLPSLLLLSTFLLALFALEFHAFQIFLIGAFTALALERIQAHKKLRAGSVAAWERLRISYANMARTNQSAFEALAEANARYDSIAPEQRDLLAQEIRAQQESLNIFGDLPALKAEEQRQRQLIADLKARIVSFEEEELLQSFGFYKPLYDCADSEGFRRLLEQVRDRQKAMVKDHKALRMDGSFTIEGDKSAGKKIATSLQKLILRAFNGECDATIDKVTFSNLDAIKARITKSYHDLNGLCELVGVSITQAYLNAKIEELQVCYEYQMKLKEEKEEQRKIREQMREQALRAKEIEDAEQKIKKDENHFTAAIAEIRARMEAAAQADRDAYQQKIREYQEKLAELEKTKTDVEYRKIHARAGYVYVISNIGSFGPDVYKIGVTLREDPQERIDELGDASVPFKFDVHARIFSQDAFSLEAALHREFGERRVNSVNTRKEFFRVDLDDVERVVRSNHDAVVEFTKLAKAEDYRLTLAKTGQHVPANLKAGSS